MLLWFSTIRLVRLYEHQMEIVRNEILNWQHFVFLVPNSSFNTNIKPINVNSSCALVFFCSAKWFNSLFPFPRIQRVFMFLVNVLSSMKEKWTNFFFRWKEKFLLLTNNKIGWNRKYAYDIESILKSYYHYLAATLSFDILTCSSSTLNYTHCTRVQCQFRMKMN